MLLIFVRRNKTMILVGIFSFYIGCVLTLSFLRIDCTDAVNARSKHTPLDNIEYAVLVLSGPNNEARRDAIRSTWVKFATNIFRENGEILYKWNHTWIGSHVEQNFIKIYFAVGITNLNTALLAKLKDEDQRTHDMLLLDLEDSYNKLSAKVLSSMKWFDDNLNGLKYVVKCDDDSFVRVDLIVRDLDAFAPNMNAQVLKNYVTFKNNLKSYKGLYWGYFDGRASAFSQGKWKETDWILCDTYLPYALGGGYVISQSIVNFLARNGDFLSQYNSEDVSMGVWTAALEGINRVHDIRFDTEWKSRGCTSNMLIRHKQSTADMFQMYKTLVYSQGEKLCKTEILERKKYFYNWTAVPSKCCR